MLADMVTVGSRVADVGCDHGFLSIWLVQTGVSPKVLAMDVRKGPLAAAREHIEAYGLGDYIETRLSDGLKNCEGDEVETLVCAGMGGRLMERILTESMEKVRGLKELILQPQSELWAFRTFLRREGFTVLQEEAVCEAGKYYFAMKACFAGKAVHDAGDDGNRNDAEAESAAFWEKKISAEREQQLCDRFGEMLIAGKNPVLLQYLQQRKKTLSQLVLNMRSVGDRDGGDAFESADDWDAGDAFESVGDRDAGDAFESADERGTTDALGTAGASEESKTGSERKRMRMDEILAELADVNYALERMQ